MPLIDLPTEDSSLTGGDVPVRDASDVLAQFPATHRRKEVAPVRDAFAAAWAEGFKEYQNVAARAAGQCDPLQATGEYLRSYADERGIVIKVGESEQSIRDRLFTPPNIVTPQAIIDEVNALIAPYTDGRCTLSEIGLDGWFVHDSTPSVWNSFIGTSPNYPDRYYAEIPSLEPGGAIPFWRTYRHFLLRVPPLEANDSSGAYIFSTPNSAGPFVSDGTGLDSVGWYVFVSPQKSQDLYESIVGLVETIKGQGISWTLVVDPLLTP